jgi:hypothetical protein
MKTDFGKYPRALPAALHLRVCPQAGPIPPALQMDGKFIGINALFVLNYAHGG